MKINILRYGLQELFPFKVGTCAMKINILRYGLQELFPFKVGKMISFHAKYMCNENNIYIFA